MEQEIKVSVIIPIYNGEKSLRCCLDSVLNQSLKEIEVLCCDDGSIDNTQLILEEYSQRDERLIVFHQNNLGAGSARNKCLEVVKGEYVCFLDADDKYYSKNALEILYKKSVENQALASCGFMKMLKNGKVTDWYYFRDLITGEKEEFVEFKKYQLDMYFTCYLIKTEVIKNNNIVFPSFKVYEDPPFLIQCLDVAQKVLIVPVEFYLYILNEKKDFFNRERTNDMVKGLKWQLEFALSHGYERVAANVIRYMNTAYAGYIVQNMKENNFELLQSLIEINALMDKDNIVLDVLKIMLPSMENINFDVKKFLYIVEKYSLQNCKLVIYGAGKVGLNCIEAIMGKEDVKLVAWIDEYKKGRKEKEIWIEGIERLIGKNYDYLLIAIEDKMIAERVKKELMAVGVEGKKILFWE